MGLKHGPQNGAALLKDLLTAAVVNIGRGEKSEARMAVLRVVPGKEFRRVAASIFQRAEA